MQMILIEFFYAMRFVDDYYCDKCASVSCVFLHFSLPILFRYIRASLSTMNDYSFTFAKQIGSECVCFFPFILVCAHMCFCL